MKNTHKFNTNSKIMKQTVTNYFFNNLKDYKLFWKPRISDKLFSRVVKNCHSNTLHKLENEIKLYISELLIP